MALREAIKDQVKMRPTMLNTSDQVRTDWITHPTRFHFWYMGVLRLCVGIGQIVVVVWCFVLLIRQGINAQTMHIAFIGVGITTASLVLFKVLAPFREWMRKRRD